MDDVTQAARIRHYVETGKADIDPQGWPGANVFEQARNQHAALSSALIAEVRRRATGAVPPPSGSRPTHSSGRSRGWAPRWARSPLSEIGDVAWFTRFSQLRKLAGLDIVRVQSGQYAGQAGISKCGRGLLRWALYQAAMGVTRTAAERDPVRSAPRGRSPAPAALSGRALEQQSLPSPGSRQRDITTWRPSGTAGGHWRAAPTLESQD